MYDCPVDITCGGNPNHEISCSSRLYMARARYWKLTADEMETISYDQNKLLNWEIKCTRTPEEDAVFIGVFLYRNGTPLDYTPIKGVVYYHNHVPTDEIPKITEHLQKRYGGKETKKGDRVFLMGSREFFDPAEIASLARSMEETFGTVTIISLEFDGLSQEQMRESGLPDAKLLPVPGK